MEEHRGAADDVHPTYIECVEGSVGPAVYTVTDGEMLYMVHEVEETGAVYLPADTYSQVSQAAKRPAVLDTEDEDARAVRCIIQETLCTEPSVDDVRHPNPKDTAQVSPATVQWLMQNYEVAEGVSIPRAAVYSHYLCHCREDKLEPVNAATFGKLIHSVFLGLSTRRLGARGNSMYHYCGIQVRPGSTQNQQPSAIYQQPSLHKRYNLRSCSSGSMSCGILDEHYQQNTSHSASSDHVNSLQQHPVHHRLDGSGAVPDFPLIHIPSQIALPEDCTLEDVGTLRSIYRDHCEAFLEAVVNLKFQAVGNLWREFWQSQYNYAANGCEEDKYLYKAKLYILCKYAPVQQFVQHIDHLFYKNLVKVIIPDVLRPIPSSLRKAISNFAKGLESSLTAAMTGCPEEMVRIKVSAVSTFAQSLQRHTSLNRLANAASGILQNSAYTSQMLVDLNEIDFHDIQEQVSWLCRCDYGVILQLETDFKVMLQRQNSLEEWAAWLECVVTQVVKPYERKPNFAKAARQFLFEWSLYSSMVMRGLSLQCAASFGYFHLIRLLCDEYLFFLVEHQLALETWQTPVAVMEGELQEQSVQC